MTPDITNALKTYMLQEGDTLIGRASDCAVKLTDSSVNRQHAVIRWQIDKLSLFDLGSTGGTELDGQPVCGTPSRTVI
jgi:S-DNA-T family DNA segregation ATPase FtsK/SpoIIIE